MFVLTVVGGLVALAGAGAASGGVFSFSSAGFSGVFSGGDGACFSLATWFCCGSGPLAGDLASGVPFAWGFSGAAGAAGGSEGAAPDWVAGSVWLTGGRVLGECERFDW